MREYVLGFVFDLDVGLWLGVFKEKGPEANRQKWNGIGGKIERGETALAAMMREGREEVGHDFDWDYVGMFGEPEVWNVIAFRAYADYWDERWHHPGENDVGEQMEWRDIDTEQFADVTVYNLRWLLPMVAAPCVVKFDIQEGVVE